MTEPRKGPNDYRGPFLRSQEEIDRAQQREDLARMKGLSFAIAVAIVVLLITTFVWIESCDGQEISNEYIFAVVARNPGAAGTNWRTGLCLTNPQWNTLQINLQLWQDGAMVGAAAFVDSDRTLCSDDFIFDYFGFKRYQGTLIARTIASQNPDLDHIQFTPSVRVYNLTSLGTFGVNVSPFPRFMPYDPLGGLYAWGQASGIYHWGEPGEDGFRAAVGAFNISDSPRSLEVWVRARNSNVVYHNELVVPAKSQVQETLPEWVEIPYGGSVTMQDPDWRDDDRPPVYGYATVVDNQTGDGVFHSMMQVHEWQIEED